VIFPIVDASFKEILNSYTLYPIHSVSLSRASLAICKNSYYSLVKDIVKDWSNLIKIKLLASLIFSECIIKFELRIFDLFGYTVYLIPTVVYNNSRVGD
jgi:hypothetical protein